MQKSPSFGFFNEDSLHVTLTTTTPAKHGVTKNKSIYEHWLEK